MIVHLLESTLFLALAILIAHLPRLAARTRYMIVFTALMKFAIPSAVVPRMLSLFGVDLSGMAKGTIVIEALGPLNASNASATSTSLWPLVALVIWATVAAALFARSLVRGRRAIGMAFINGQEGCAADVIALDRARLRAGVTRPVRLVRSSAITPSTAGIVRPIIVIPSATNLTDAELETILAHECAHIARHDNLLNIIESIAGCALWFHPLVWIARRVLDAAREEACDAIVIASGDATIYVTALGKVCGAAIGPHPAGVSCIVSNTIRKRMEAIMSFGTRRLLPHRAATAIVIAFLAVATIGSGVARALPAPDHDASPYRVDVNAVRLGSNFDFFLSVRNRSDSRVVYSARLRSRVEEWGTAQSGTMDPDGEHKTVIRVKGHADGSATVEIATDDAAPIVRTIIAKKAHAVKKESAQSPDTISIDLKDADIRDVLRTFAQLTNTNIIADDDVTGHVTLTVREVPWTEAFDNMLRQNNLRSERVGNTIYVHRQ